MEVRLVCTLHKQAKIKKHWSYREYEFVMRGSNYITREADCPRCIKRKTQIEPEYPQVRSVSDTDAWYRKLALPIRPISR